MEKNFYRFDRMNEEFDINGNRNHFGYSETYVNEISTRIHEIGKKLQEEDLQK